jgi:hypothetical protein
MRSVIVSADKDFGQLLASMTSNGISLATHAGGRPAYSND